jgi:NitT/TauT family transport system substrate-binding protein
MVIVDLMRRTRSAARAFVAALACLAFFSVLANETPARADTAIHFTLDRKIDGPAAPFFLAIDRGYFKDEGLDVTIDGVTNGPLESINRLASGNYDMGVVDINLLIKFRDANPGTPIRALFAIFDKPPYAIVARKSRGIAAPKDLEGKKLGAPTADSAFAQWAIFIKVNAIDGTKVTIENVGPAVLEPMLAAGEVDAIAGFSFTYVDLKDRGVPPDDLRVLLMDDYGVNLYGDVIAVTPTFAAEKPEAVRAFLRAYVRALRDTVRDPVRAIEALLHHDDTEKKNVELERLRMAIHDNILTPAVKAEGYGAIDPQRLAAAIDQLALTYQFKAKDKAAEVLDLSFLPSAAERSASVAASR